MGVQNKILIAFIIITLISINHSFAEEKPIVDYETPKLKILLITNDINSLFSKILSEKYSLKTSTSFIDPNEFDLIIFDNKPAVFFSESNIALLKKFLSEGGGVITHIPYLSLSP